MSVVLSKQPVKIIVVSGFTQEKEQIGVYPSGNPVLRSKFRIVPEGAPTVYRGKYRYNYDTWTLDGTELNIEEKYREYNRETRRGKKTHTIVVSYRYNKTYDPIYAKLEEA